MAQMRLRICSGSGFEVYTSISVLLISQEMMNYDDPPHEYYIYNIFFNTTYRLVLSEVII
jgi:hypothetical protein